MATTTTGKTLSLGIVGWRRYTKPWWPAMNALVQNLLTTEGIEVARVVSGGAAGADAFAVWFAKHKGLPMLEHKPKPAGVGYRAYAVACLSRNTDIVNDSDLVIAFMHPESKGTLDTIGKAEKRAGCRLVVFDLPHLEELKA